MAVTAPPGATRLGFLGMANHGPSTGQGTIRYTDGSTQPYTLGFSDWTGSGGVLAPGTRVVVVMPYLSRRGDQRRRDECLCGIGPHRRVQDGRRRRIANRGRPRRSPRVCAGVGPVALQLVAVLAGGAPPQQPASTRAPPTARPARANEAVCVPHAPVSSGHRIAQPPSATRSAGLGAGGRIPFGIAVFGRLFGASAQRVPKVAPTFRPRRPS